MWAYHPELLETPVPRYTSYPTAAEFGPVAPGSLEAALDGVSGNVSLYVHIPFCEQICWYCGCNTAAANRRERLESYLEALTHEIVLVGRRVAGRVRVRHLAFGGGSPNAISPTDFVRLTDALTVAFALDRPTISVEVDPRRLPPAWRTVFTMVGVTQASLGVQTFDPALQAAIGRVQPEADIRAALDLLRAAGVASVNFDLMYGLPGQTLHSLEDSLARTAAMGANRVALFGYAHVPHMIPRQRRIDAGALPDSAQRFAMAEFGHRYLCDRGYVPVGFDHFALPGDPLAQAVTAGRLHRNFQGFTADDAPVLIGLGSTAISCFPEGLYQNEKNAGRYRMLLSQDRLTANHGIARSAEDRRRGEVITALLCQGRAVLRADLQREVAPLLQPFLSRGLARLDDGLLEILPCGLPYARTIAALFDQYRRDSMRRFSSAI